MLQHSEPAWWSIAIDLDLPRRRARPTPSECALLYTSGTTGKPKGCLLSNFYFLNVARRYLAEGGLCEVREGEERLITPLPLFHMNSLAVSTVAMILAGGCVVQLDRFHPRSWWQDVAMSGATIVHYLGVMPAILLSQPPGPYDRAHRVRFGYGANANPKDHAAFEAALRLPAGRGLGHDRDRRRRADRRQPRAAGTSARDASGSLPRTTWMSALSDESGELLVRQQGADPRKGFFSGYYKDQAATEDAWRDGWFHTGDAMRRGPDGQLHFVDRRKNIIRRSGENIAALEVEATLAGHPAIQQVAIIAAPDPVRDEEVMACVVPTGNKDLEPAQCRSRTGASSACPTSRRRATSPSSTSCRSPPPTRCRRRSWPTSP